jgi:hypothetical protein
LKLATTRNASYSPTTFTAYTTPANDLHVY